MKIDKMPQKDTDTGLSSRRLYLGSTKGRLMRLVSIQKTSAVLIFLAVVAIHMMSIDHKPTNSRQDEIPTSWPAFAICTICVLSLILAWFLSSACILVYMETTTSINEAVKGSPQEIPMFMEVTCLLLTELGVLSFFAEISIIIWINFYSLSPTAVIASIIIIAITGILIIINLVFFKVLCTDIVIAQNDIKAVPNVFHMPVMVAAARTSDVGTNI